MLFIVFLILGGCLVFGAAVVLLKTAKAPKIPENFKPKPDDDEDDTTGW